MILIQPRGLWYESGHAIESILLKSLDVNYDTFPHETHKTILNDGGQRLIVDGGEWRGMTCER